MALVCDICKIRPAEARITFLRNGQPRVIDVCGQDYAALQANPNLSIALPEENFGQPVFNQEIDLTPLLSEPTKLVLQGAAESAIDFSSPKIENTHLLISLTNNKLVRSLLDIFKINPTDIQGYLEANLFRGTAVVTAPIPSTEVQAILAEGHRVSTELGHSYIGPEHLLIGLLQTDQEMAGSLLKKYGLTPESLRQQVVKQVGDGAPDGVVSPEKGTPSLNKYSRDLTALAKEGKLDPVIGRTDEIETLVEVLSRRTKNNPVLIGEPGVGKTAVVECLAQQIIAGKVPEGLKDKRLLELSLTSLIAGTRYRGEFEERLQTVLEEIRNHQEELLIFVDELHTVVGAGGNEGGLDTANVLKPSLARGELHLIGATTLNEYHKHIEKDAAFERRFQPITIAEPSLPDAKAILFGLRERYEKHHSVTIADPAIVAAVELSHRYMSQRFLPDKAIDLIDQAAARAHIAGLSTVDAQNIADIVAKLTGVPLAELTQLEREKLLNLEEKLHERVIGQEEAIRAVANAIRVSRVGLSSKHSPIATFLFLGPTGVGKTEVAKALADTMFGSEDNLVRIDMSEYMERHSVSRLIGSPPGYIGHDEGGQLTEIIRRRPHSVILLDEIEKAHPDVYNLLLQVFDDGRLTDSKGRVVDFSNTIIIATSNISTKISKATSIGFTLGEEPETAQKHKTTDFLKHHFKPEFINRLDEVIAFHSLEKKHIGQIVKMQLTKLKDRLAEQHIQLRYTAAVQKYLAEVGFNPEFGARELRRRIKSEIENQIAKNVLEGLVKQRENIKLEYTPKKGLYIA
jgi:ATP-dependent Clp protease ATP-binding subunit ClpC